MTRTLYLNGKGREIRLKVDGPSLLITSPDCADRRIPVPMLARVVVFGNILIDSDVLNLLGSRDIPVIFIDKYAKSRATSLPLNYSMPLPCNSLQIITKDEKKRKEFIDWARQMRIFLQNTVIRNLYHHNCNVTGIDYRKIIYMLMPENRVHWFIAKSLLRILLWLLILEELHNNRFDPHCGIIHNKSSFGLVQDYFYILQSETDLQALQFFKTDSIDLLIEEKTDRTYQLTARGFHNIIHRFENKQYMVKKNMKSITDKILELMGGDNESKLSRVLRHQG